MNLGTEYLGNNRCRFRVWSPFTKDIKVKIFPSGQIFQLVKEDEQYWSGEFDNIPPGTKYMFRINDGMEKPDPMSNFQPEDVHSASQVVDHSSYRWGDSNWEPIPLEDYILYELHIGTFTPEGTFESAVSKIPHLKELGITAVEVMPVSQFPGDRNWGYDGVYPYAPQNNYGGPQGLKKLVDAMHQNGIAVILDVVYNHLGPEGNYLSQFAPYFTKKYKTPWGNSINFDDEYSDEVKKYFIHNALYWLDVYHFDGLRLDAIDKIYDFGARPFLQELAENVEQYEKRRGKKKLLIAESDLNDEKIIRPLKDKGIGMDAQWSDDFHHSLHSLATGEKDGYYMDFGKPEDLALSLQDTFVFNGKYSKFRKRRHGNNPAERNLNQFIFNLQNHDQIGNRGFGERISTLISFELYKLSTCVLLTAPAIPLIFMGQEFYETSPFLYFISHTDQELIKAVQKGRREEFSHFHWKEDIPDPFSEETFERSKPDWNSLSDEKNRVIFNLHKNLISYRKNNSVFKDNERMNIHATVVKDFNIVLFHRKSAGKSIFSIMNFEPAPVTTFINIPEGNWKKIIDTSSEEWLGPDVSTADNLKGMEQNLTLKRESFVLYESE
jgi:maltooligosyltrehalose trehalohydrolase